MTYTVLSGTLNSTIPSYNPRFLVKSVQHFITAKNEIKTHNKCIKLTVLNNML